LYNVSCSVVGATFARRGDVLAAPDPRMTFTYNLPA